MTKYKRITGKVFGGNATATGGDPQIAQFGSALANTFVGTTDPEVIQQLPAWGQGWIGAVTPDSQFPALPEMTGAMKVLSHQICTAEQEGVSSWDSGTVYYATNFVSKNGKLFISQTNENQGNDPETDTTNWQEFASGEWGKIEGNISNQADLQEQLSNKVDINSKVIDGQWINISDGPYIVSNVSIAAYESKTYDISNWLPNDGYSYEVSVITRHKASVAGAEMAVRGSLITKNVVGRTYAPDYIFNMSGTIIVSPDREVRVTAGSTAIYSIYISIGCYRRVGTNE